MRRTDVAGVVVVPYGRVGGMFILMRAMVGCASFSISFIASGSILLGIDTGGDSTLTTMGGVFLGIGVMILVGTIVGGVYFYKKIKNDEQEQRNNPGGNVVPPPPGLYPQQTGGNPSYPQVNLTQIENSSEAGAHPFQLHTYPPTSGAHPPYPGAYAPYPQFPVKPGAYPVQPGAYPAQSGAYPAQSGAYPAQPGTYPTQSDNPHPPPSYQESEAQLRNNLQEQTSAE
ncbi:calcium-binding protein P-like [Homarus americanus]|uniref:Calcium-binding protein P-like n=1 Tax=Homarus americanus TaxID=6706 RepID=A0A8J5KJD8_HOMAM|nr:calcium-binding protein P-like [Homarus americanus]KAG7170965.1 Calcium-binding protein P-like [Homarus americanus]